LVGLVFGKQVTTASIKCFSDIGLNPILSMQLISNPDKSDESDLELEPRVHIVAEWAVMPVERILRGLKRFQRLVFPKHRDLFQKLALGQRPEALFITCADSRIDPCLLTQAKPGELFICRVIGNVVPRYPKTIGGVSATIEYAVGVLGVPDVIVCGHTDCGVMKGVLNPDALKPLANVSAWLRHAQPARRAVEKSRSRLSESEFLLALAERNVIEQLKNLQTHPSVVARLEQGSLNLHGWMYHIGEGMVTTYDPGREGFFPVPALKPPDAKPRETDLASAAKHSKA
jgi:carbonic anhydrase